MKKSSRGEPIKPITPRFSSEGSWKEEGALQRSLRRVTATTAKEPLRMIPQIIGWVTALAGLLAYESLLLRQSSQFPSGLFVTLSSSLTVAEGSYGIGGNGHRHRIPFSSLPKSWQRTST